MEGKEDGGGGQGEERATCQVPVEMLCPVSRYRVSLCGAFAVWCLGKGGHLQDRDVPCVDWLSSLGVAD